MKRQIIAMGGGGFSMEPDNPLLDEYILAQVDAPRPKILFVGSASLYDQDYRNCFYKAFEQMNCIPNHLEAHQENLESIILSHDIIYVGGGNTLKMLSEWKERGMDQVLKKAYQQGIVLCGLSAGAICWFEEGLTDSLPGELGKISCLGILEGSNCPHFDGEPERQVAYKNKIISGEMKRGIACDDGVAVHYVNETIYDIVSSRPRAKAYHYELIHAQLVEAILKPKLIMPTRVY